MFVAFDAGYADPKTNEPVSIGFAVSNDNGNTWKAYSFSQDWGYKNITGSKPVIVSNGYGDVFIFFENHTSGSYFEYLVHYHTNGSYSDGAPVWYVGVISNWNWWSSVYSISASGMGPDIAISFEYRYFDSSGNPEDSDIWVVYSEDSDSWEDTWTKTEVAISNNYELRPSVTITASANPYIYVAYEIKEYKSTGIYYYELYFNYTSVGSTSWSTGVRLYVSDGTEGLDDDILPSISSSSNYVFVVWEHDYYDSSLSLVTSDLWLANISAESGTVQTTYKLTSNTGSLEENPAVWVSDNWIFISYFNATSNGDFVYLIFSKDGGHTWSVPEQISGDGEVNVTIPATDVCYYNGYLYIVWSDDGPGSVNQEYADIFFYKQTIPEFTQQLLYFILLILVGYLINRRRRLRRDT